MVLPEGFLRQFDGCGVAALENLGAALATDASVSVRFNRGKAAGTAVCRDVASSDAVLWCADGVYLSSRPAFTLDPALHQGLYYVQDASSMFISHVVSFLTAGGAPVRYLDACAAPGGKTTAAVDALPPGSLVVANEYVAARAAVLRENLVKWGAPCAVCQGDTARFAASGAVFDIIAADVPCSGEGMMRKEPDARSQWSKGLIAGCAALQREIVADAAETLRPGGYLVYSTCTFNRTENEDMLDYMASELGLESVDLHLDDEWGIPDGLTGRPAKRFMPHLTRGEGLFVAVMRKPFGESDRRKRKRRTLRPKQAMAGGVMLRDKENYMICDRDGMVVGIPFALAEVLDRLPEKTRVVCAGVELGEVKGKDFIPSQAIALSTSLRRDIYPEVELSRSAALAYLRKENVDLPDGTPRGYVLATFRGLPLGWLKNLGNRCNNLYPKNWRIRM